ncbi:amino acid permease [Eubacteriaceae bacterium ES3]|nr:amino acid permease [Eubacteriaceae bacterium ES3]
MFNKKETTEEKAGLRTFEGVYTPTLLTILGVILYLRMGWVVGNAGLLGAVIIILLAHVITLTTSLSMASMLTNIKIGAGGAYAIITRSLGHEMGGAIGIPLYFSQTISTAFYITGFSELWVSFFPDHSQILVGVITWAMLTGISLLSAKLAFRIQYIVLAAVFLSLISFILGPNLSSGRIVMNGSFADADFWTTFAIFFPAVTGILTGATMSGDLKDPRKSIIKGTLAAVITGLAVYLFVAYWFAHQASQTMLLNDPSIIFKLSKVQALIVAGVMGAVLSSALSTLVSAPRTLAALAENRVVPFSPFLAKPNKRGEPFNAILLSSGLSALVIIFGNLDSLAELLTMFFLTTYVMINMVVFVEEFTGVISYRPTMKIPIIIPLTGSIGCIAVMFLINPIFTIISFIIIVTLYVILKRHNFSSPSGDVRGGIFVAIAEWAAQKSAAIPDHPRIWKPAIAVPIENPANFKRVSRIILSLTYPAGRVYYISTTEATAFEPEQIDEIDQAISLLPDKNIFVQKTLISESDFDTTLRPVLQSLQSSYLPPNIVFFTISDELEKRQRLYRIMASIEVLNLSYFCLWLHPKQGFGIEKKINIWLRDKSPNNDLIVLTALQLSRNFAAEINLCRVIGPEDDRNSVYAEMAAFIDNTRLPVNTKICVYTGSFVYHVKTVDADFNIIGMPFERDYMSQTINASPCSILFVSSCGSEDAML